MNFTKIKISKDGGITLKWTTESGKDSTVHELASFDKPEPGFPESMQALVPEVLRVCELPDDYTKGLTVIGISISYNDEQGMGAVVTCLKELSTANAPLVINTPHLPEYSEHGPTMRRQMLEAIEAVQERARRFINGNREQQLGLLDAIADLAPKPDSGIESITISSTIDGEKQSVTLTAEDGKRMRKAAATAHA